MNHDEPGARRRWLAAAGAGLGAATLAARAAGPADEIWPPITAFPSGRWSPGRWVWADLFTEDVAASERFYAAVFGWRFEPTAALGGRYRLALADDEAVGAIVPREAGPGTAPGSRWMPLMSVEDPARAARDAGRNGGRVVVAPTLLPGRGEVAILGDPEGLPFGVIRALGGDPDDYLAELNEWVWLELWALDPERAARFYAPLGGSEIERETDDAGTPYLQLSSGGFGRASIRKTLFPDLPPVWIPFLRVADAGATAARVRAAGGRLVVEPRADRLDGRVAICVDSGGAPFGVLAVQAEAA
ncbi:MAG: VOC family protein [Burkholderiales bacterium]|nr:VOC family protein [Burkholderiales bacterium]